MKPIGPKEVVASGPGWETQRYETTGGLVCLDTWFSDGGMSGGCFDPRENELQWGGARHKGVYIMGSPDIDVGLVRIGSALSGRSDREWRPPSWLWSFGRRSPA
ncbi:MAG: hypothetical protein ACREA0_12890, partial [bacterium]